MGQRYTSQEKSVRKMKAIATGLLVLMVIVFVASHLYLPFYPWLEWVLVFSEAAMIGALADWFAVTALFRHPLGLPIPHTAIIPSRQEEIGSMLGRFFQSNFLTPEIIASKLNQKNLAFIIGQWLEVSEQRERLRRSIVRLLPYVINTLSDEEIKNFIQRTLLVAFKEADVALVAGKFLDILVSGDREGQVLSEGSRLLRLGLEKHQAFLGERLRGEMPWYVPDFVHDHIYRKVLARVVEILGEMETDQNHPLRAYIRKVLAAAIEQLSDSENFKEAGEDFKKWLLHNDVVRQYVAGLWAEIRKRLNEDVKKEESLVHYFVDNMLRGASLSLMQDESFQRRVNRIIREAVLEVLRVHGGEIAAIVSETVRQWDAKTLINKIELEVGSDLQFIRLNGTIVGGLAGLVIYMLWKFLQ